jgi:hypothetical protein
MTQCDEDDEIEIFEPFHGKIWTGAASIPEGIQGVQITLDGKEHSDLDWSAPIAEAQKMIAQGYKILWKLDLGLFGELLHPLSDERQLTTLKLSLQHFREAVWDLYSRDTIGLVLYEGAVTFDDISDGEQAYQCRDIAADYITYLTAALPDDLRVMLKLTIPTEIPPSVVVGLLNPDRFEKIEWIHNGKHPLHASWIEKRNILIPVDQKASARGFCIPYPTWMPQGEGILEELLKEDPALRFVPEGAITSCWDQLDELIVLENYLTPFGKRQLQGFVAAGGNVSHK